MLDETLLKQALSLPVPERQELWQQLGESLFRDPEAFHLGHDVRKELERRYEDALKNPDDGYSFEEVEAMILARLKS